MYQITISVPSWSDVKKLFQVSVVPQPGPSAQAGDVQYKPPKVRYWVPVVGTTFEGRQDLIKALVGNEVITLKVESYPNYPNAVGVYANGVKIGHLPDKQSFSFARMIKDKLAAGKSVEVVAWEKHGGSTECPRYGVRIQIVNDR